MNAAALSEQTHVPSIICILLTQLSWKPREKLLKTRTMCKFGTPTPNNSPISTICVSWQAASTKLYPFSHERFSLRNSAEYWMQLGQSFDSMRCNCSRSDTTMTSIQVLGGMGIMIFLRVITIYGQVYGANVATKGLRAWKYCGWRSMINRGLHGEKNVEIWLMIFETQITS